MDFDEFSLLDEFVVEAREFLAKIEEDFIQLEKQQDGCSWRT